MLSAAVVVPKKTYVVFMVAKETVFKGELWFINNFGQISHLRCEYTH